MNSKTKIKKIVFMLFVAVFLIASPIAFSGCSETVIVSGAKINDNGELILTYSNGSEQNLGVVVGKDGSDGTNGQDGTVIIDGEGSHIAFATSKGIQSAVSITCKFTKTVQNEFGGFRPGHSYGGSSRSEYSSAGSGVIYQIDKSNGDAFIITNYHVVYDVSSNTENNISDNISVYLYGSETEDQAIKAEYVGGSLYYDIAVLYIENSELLKNSCAASAVFADSDMTVVGEPAIAIGNPEGMGISASYGIVSVDSENLTMTAADGSTTVSFRVMRVDAAVNSGNSGGGLYNESGELMGIVNAKIVDDSVENIGYAIPSNVASAVADNIIDNCFEKENERVLRGILGITVTSSGSHAEYDTATGRIYIVEKVEVYELTKDGLASGFLEVGDVIQSITIGDKTTAVTRQHHIIDAMLEVHVGDKVSLTVTRNGETKTVSVTVDENNIVEY